MSDSGVDAGEDSDSLGQMSVGSSAGSDDGHQQDQVAAVQPLQPVQAEEVNIQDDVVADEEPQNLAENFHEAEPVAGSSRSNSSGCFELVWQSDSMPNVSFSSPSFRMYQQWKDLPEQHDFCPKMKVQRKSASKFVSILDHDLMLQKKLRMAANTGDTDLIRKLLDDGVDPCAGDCRNRTALHFAACKGDVTTARLLLERGADPNLQDSVGNTPLHLAACTNNTEMVSLLLTYQTDVTTLDKRGRSPIQLAESKLKLLQSSDGSEVARIKVQVLQVIEMISIYLQKSGKQEAVDLLTSFTSRLHLHQTKEEVDGDVQDLLSNLSHLSLSKPRNQNT